MIGFCPSCHTKRQAAFGEFVTEEILEPVPHRHVVISLPRRLRPFFRRRKRLASLARLAYETIKDLLQAAAGTCTAVPGAVACMQSAGSLLDWHPHVHLLISWGLFRRDGSFIPVEGTPDPETVARLFRYRVLRNAQIDYRSDAVHPRHRANFRVFDPLDFLAEVSAHIPDAHEKTTLFYGWYSNRTRGYRKQHGLLAKAEAADPVPGSAGSALPNPPPVPAAGPPPVPTSPQGGGRGPPELDP